MHFCWSRTRSSRTPLTSKSRSLCQWTRRTISFLIAHLQMEAVIHNANSVTTLFSALEDLPSGLEEAHQDTLKRIEAQSKSSISLAKRVFTWLLYANRKLTTQDVQSAMAVSIEKLSYAQGDMVPISVILAACCGLVEVRDHGDRRDPQQVASGAPDEVCFIRKSPSLPACVISRRTADPMYIASTRLQMLPHKIS